MDKLSLQLIEGLRAFLWQERASCFLDDNEQWQAFWELALEQRLLPLLADSLMQDYRLIADKEAADYIRRLSVGSLVGQSLRSRRFLEIYSELTKAGLKPLVVKGIVCRELYPKGELRLSGDEDLLILPEDADKIFALLEGCGLKRCGGAGEDDQVTSYVDEESSLHLELHRSLFGHSSGAYGNLNRYFAEVFESAVLTSVQGRGIWTFDVDKHLLYLIFHSFKHFVHSGFGIRQLADICMFSHVHGDKLDWQGIFEALKQANADIFAANLLQIGREYLGFAEYCEAALAILDKYEAALDCAELLEDLLSGGIYGNASTERSHSSLITLTAFGRGETTSGERLMRTIFPKKTELEGAYTYLGKQPYLLPLAWGQRIFGYLSSDRQRRGSAGESIAIGERRVELLKKYKVIR